MAPVVPFVARCADRIGYQGNKMVIRRDGRVARALTGMVEPTNLQAYYVAVVPLLRALGSQVSYDPATRMLFVRCQARKPLRTPGPNEQRTPQVAPTTVFTPEPVPTPRPTFSGSPHPRRTPIVVTTPRA